MTPHARPYAAVRRESRLRWWVGFAIEFVTLALVFVAGIAVMSLAAIK